MSRDERREIGKRRRGQEIDKKGVSWKGKREEENEKRNNINNRHMNEEERNGKNIKTLEEKRQKQG